MNRKYVLLIGISIIVILGLLAYCEFRNGRCKELLSLNWKDQCRSDIAEAYCACADWQNNKNSYWPSYWLPIIRHSATVHLTYKHNCCTDPVPMVFLGEVSSMDEMVDKINNFRNKNILMNWHEKYNWGEK